MKSTGITIVFFAVVLFPLSSYAQPGQLQKGFNKTEYIDMLRMAARQVDTPWTTVKEPEPLNFRLQYRSPVVGLDNRWDLWIANDKSSAVISVRGTTANSISWMENFYAAMVPAKGSVKISDSFTFSYQLADNPAAAVHIGWLLALATLSDDIIHTIDSCERSGIKNFYITGHSQGGAIAYLLTSHIRYLQQSGRLSNQLYFKTYCSAGPKPGNLYYAYDYESKTAEGTAYNVVNTVDWVPELPFSIQSVKDFNYINPFTDVKKILNKKKFPANLVLKHMYNRLRKPSEKATRRFQRVMGKYIYKTVKKVLPGYVQPAFYPSNNYVRTGTTIVLLPDEQYYNSFPNDKTRLFVHHFPSAYLFLAEKLK